MRFEGYGRIIFYITSEKIRVLASLELIMVKGALRVAPTQFKEPALPPGLRFTVLILSRSHTNEVKVFLWYEY